MGGWQATDNTGKFTKIGKINANFSKAIDEDNCSDSIAQSSPFPSVPGKNYRPMQLRNANHALARLAAGILASGLLIAATHAVADEVPVNQLQAPSTNASAANASSTSLNATSASGADSSAVAISPATLRLAQSISQNGFNPSDASGAASQADMAQDDGTAGAPVASTPRGSFLAGVASKAGDVVVGALNLIGVRYRWGGNTPDSGLDCSGFVRYVFQDTLGFTLPRRAVEMSRVGEKVSFNDLKPGDLVFFNTVRRTISHVGIYIGHDKFVHSPSTGSTIRVDEMNDRYWETRFREARRVSLTGANGADDDGNDIAARIQRATHVAY